AERARAAVAHSDARAGLSSRGQRSDVRVVGQHGAAEVRPPEHPRRTREGDGAMIREDEPQEEMRVSAEPVPDRTACSYSVVIPVYNSEAIVGQTVSRVVEVFEGAGLRYEIVLVNDGSPDRSWAVISEIARTTPHVVALNMLKNYGQHHANLAGFMEST